MNGENLRLRRREWPVSPIPRWRHVLKRSWHLSFLDPTVTEDEICRIYDLTAQQVAAARAYVLGNPDTVLAEHLKIEERLAVGNPPEVRERAERTKATLQSFKRWLSEREAANGQGGGAEERPAGFPTFREWLATREGR